MNGTNYVNNILYDAKGQRQAIYYGNNTVTKYDYDPLTYRLRRLLTTANTGTDIRQDLYYYYDPVGNITRINDAVASYVFYDNTLISPHQVYTYDALYRLVIAEGREHISNTTFNSKDNYNDSGMMLATAPLQWDINALQRYIQRYKYDAVGNILELKHSAGSGGYTRKYTYDYAASGNRLLSTTVGSNVYTYIHDPRGNMSRLPHLNAMGWNSLNELGGIANSDMQAWYQYSGGQRVRKFVETLQAVEERIYLGNFEIYRKFDTLSSLTPLLERATVHISDDTGRIAMQEVLNPEYGTDGSKAELTRYIYSNHLQSATLELDETAAVISYEEYHPYGTTAYQAYNSAIKATAKRYRYTGKERDDESGLYYHGARYYVPWLCRWCACDPLESKYAGMSPYNYSFNNPVMFNDPSGADPRDPGDGDDKKPKGVWYYDKKDVLRYDKDHTYTDFPKEKGDVRGDDFRIVEGAKGGGSLHYKRDGTIEHELPPDAVKELNEKNRNTTNSEKAIPKEANPTQIEKNTPLVKASLAHVKALPVTDTKRQVFKPITEKIKVNPIEIKPQARPLQPKAQKEEAGSSGTLLSLIGMGLQYVETGLEGYKKNSWMSYAETAGEQWGNKIGGYLTKGVGWAGKGLGIFGLYTSGKKLLSDPSNPANWIKAGANIGMLFLKANPLTLGIGIGFTILDEGGYIDKWLGRKK